MQDEMPAASVALVCVDRCRTTIAAREEDRRAEQLVERPACRAEAARGAVRRLLLPDQWDRGGQHFEPEPLQTWVRDHDRGAERGES